jgi:Zn-finger nucleic acid-binding protein
MDVAPLKCPRGDHALEPLTVAGLDLDRCGQCSLIWFDERELQRLLRQIALGREVRLALRSPATNLDDSLVCPRCRGPSLDVGIWRRIPLALCSTCGGVCLDAIGLKGMLDLGRGDPPPPRRFQLGGEEPDVEDVMGQSVLRALLDLVVGPAL